MRNLLTICAALVVMLGIVSGNLWYELRSAREQIVDLEGQLAEAKMPVVQSAPSQPPPTPVQPPPPPTIEAPPAPPVAAQLPESLPPPPPPPRPVIAVAPATVRVLGVPTLTTPLAEGTAEEQRVEALAQSDRTAMARATLWNTTLNLTPEQLEVLHATTMAELRHETEESLQIMSGIGSLDALSAARLNVETVTRQHATLRRIHEKMTPHLNPGQNIRMSTMFESWLRTNMARARAAEQAVLSGQ